MTYAMMDASLFSLTTDLAIPEPYATKVRALFKPWHPFLFFDVGQIEGDLVFQMGFRDIYCRDVWIRHAFPKAGVSSAFPLEGFADPVAGYTRLEAHAFRCLLQLVATELNHDQTLLAGPLLHPHTGALNIDRVFTWMKVLTEPLANWFNRTPIVNEGRLIVLATQPVALREGQHQPGWFHREHGEIRPWHAWQPFPFCNLNLEAINAQCREITQNQGIETAERLLRKLLLEELANKLYDMRFQI